eukprot:1157322-Pelagomonas_calceolata.AAC.4
MGGGRYNKSFFRHNVIKIPFRQASSAASYTEALHRTLLAKTPYAMMPWRPLSGRSSPHVFW